MFSRRLWGVFFFTFSPGGAVCLIQLSIPPLSVWNGLEVAPTPFRELYSLWQGSGLDNREFVMLLLQQWETHMLVHSTYDHLLSDVLSLVDLGGELCGSIGTFNWYVVCFAGYILTEGEPKNGATEVKKTLRTWLAGSSWDMTHAARSSDTFLRDFGRFVEHNVVSAFVRVWDGRVVCRGSTGVISAMAGCSVALLLHSVVSGEVAEPGLAILAALRIWSATGVYRGLHNDWKVGKTANLQGHIFGLLYGAVIGCGLSH